MACWRPVCVGKLQAAYYLANSNMADDRNRNIRLSPEDARNLLRLLKLLQGQDAPEPPPQQGESGTIQICSSMDAARWSVAVRHAREDFFPKAMFGEPAWDILLSLFVQGPQARVVGSDVAKLTNTPVSTAARWVDYLEKKSLVVREKDRRDRRVSTVSLSDEARRLLEQYFENVVSQFPDSPPGEDGVASSPD